MKFCFNFCFPSVVYSEFYVYMVYIFIFLSSEEGVSWRMDGMEWWVGDDYV